MAEGRPFQAVRAISTGNRSGGAEGAGAGRSERSQPPDSHEFGMENSLQPQSRQTRMSGDGETGG